ncbi:WD repeat protein [Stachybotrys elegans]|uniref:WD repeat protein n=1 Tax=Stachybotrys elegans TaxID=80388 RepID=A0A8K0WRI4_9HYPO|nr:WD repeat protein [Stachybotrys elegans]
MAELQCRTAVCDIQREFCRVPVTALELVQVEETLFVLAAQDTELRVYEAESARLLTRFPVFSDQSIQGIQTLKNGSAGVVLAWGASQVAVLSLEPLTRGTVPTILRGEAPDWIYDGKLSPYAPSCAVLATAHNEAITVQWSEATGKVTMGTPVSPSRPILSSAQLTWLSEECVLVVGGSFFGEILVWKYHAGRGSENTHDMLFVLTGHEGSVFGMHISPVIVLDDGSPVRLLASCSDDRTVRIWDITKRVDSDENTRAPIRLNDARETGFTSDSHNDKQLEANQVEPIAVTMGHLSRIWGVHFAASTGSTMAIWSFGEDATAQKWRLDLHQTSGSKERLNGAFTHQRTFSLHDGKNIWAHALLARPNHILIATGGADGKISLIKDPIAPSWDGERAATSIAFPSNEVVTLSAQDIVAKLPSSEISGDDIKGEIINRYDFLSEAQILVTTSRGRLLRGVFGDWMNLHAVEDAKSVAADLKKCYVLRRVGNGAAVLGTSSGNIYFYGPSDRLVHSSGLPGRIVEIIRLSELTSTSDQAVAAVEILVFLHGSSVGHCLSLDLATGSVLEKAELQGLDPRFVALCAGKVGEYLMLGSRHGWVSVTKKIDGHYRPVLELAPRSRDGVTAIIPVPGQNGKQSPYVLMTSRDGRYRIFKMEGEETSLEVLLCHESLLPFGPFVEGAWFTNDAEPELILYGFRSKYLIVWNETRRLELGSIDCGGAHRTYTLYHDRTNPESLRFACTRTSKLCLYRQERTLQSPIEAGAHGREVRTMSYNGRYLATGAEDTTIRLWEYGKGDSTARATLIHLLSVKSHVSGLQTVRWMSEDLLFSSAGFEEFFVWRLRKLEGSCVKVGIICEGVFADTSKDKDLRILDFDVCRAESGEGIIVTLAFSNTVFKTYRYTSDGKFHFLAKGTYTGACITQLRHLGRQGDDIAILTASTDGHLAIWSKDGTSSGEYVVKHIVRMHQNSIKSLELAPTRNGYRVITAGDDNSLGHALIISTQGDARMPSYELSYREIVRQAHAAAINGVLITRSRDGMTAITSVSNDQKVKVWQLADAPSGRIELLADACSGVADAGDVELIDYDETQVRVMVAGVGIEVWTVAI